MRYTLSEIGDDEEEEREEEEEDDDDVDDDVSLNRFHSSL